MAPAFKLPVTFSVEKMLADLHVLDSARWISVLPRKGQAWVGVALRSHDGEIGTLDYLPSPCKDTRLMREMPYFHEIVSYFKCELCRVRLLVMQAGAIIGEHVDVLHGEKAQEVRLHVPVITNPGAVFRIGGECLHMTAGDLWYLDVSQPHSVTNAGAESRIDLVVDCIINDWLKEMIALASRREKT